MTAVPALSSHGLENILFPTEYQQGLKITLKKYRIDASVGLFQINSQVSHLGIDGKNGELEPGFERPTL